MSKLNGDALQNAIGAIVLERQLTFYRMVFDYKAKLERGEDVGDLPALAGEQQRLVDVLIGILRVEGDPVYVQSLEAQFPGLLALAGHSPTTTDYSL